MTRRWFRFAFSLRTLFVVVTACALWLGWQVRIVQERKAVLAELRRLDDTFDFYYVGVTTIRELEGSPHIRISLARRLLGDEACWFMHLSSSVGLEWIARAEVTFPEAKLWATEPNGDHLGDRDSLYAPYREPNIGTLFKTGIPDQDAVDENSP